MSGREPWCDDWQCPAQASCALAFWRSRDYAAMRTTTMDPIGGNVPVRARPRKEGADSCAEYRFDRAKGWLMPRPGQVTHSGRRP